MKKKIFTILIIAIFYIAGSHAELFENSEFVKEMTKNVSEYIENQEKLPKQQQDKGLETLLNFSKYLKEIRKQEKQPEQPNPPIVPQQDQNLQTDDQKSHSANPKVKPLVIEGQSYTVQCPNSDDPDVIKTNKAQYEIVCELDTNKKSVPIVYTRKNDNEKFVRAPDDLQIKT